ncbi:MAG: [acyl-carrier-protein] S-malonyltransferase [Gemmatimonadales bacterium]|nr:MAG: [acyl-carrier-protein] S-malonyltransferase [Gemmatimonadales bacterium]
MSLALLLPGQGSQHVGMGRELASVEPEARRTFDEADEVLGLPLSRIMWEGPEAELLLTRNAQPAILTHSVAVFRSCLEALGPVTCAGGHSVGEFSAWVAAGAISFADALEVVRLRGELMYEAGTRRPGSMAALLGIDDEGARALCEQASSGPTSLVVPANLNAPGQVVISGDEDAIQRAIEGARDAGAKKAIRLNVSGAFHSPLMEPAVEGLRERLARVTFERPDFPVVSNVTAALVEDPADISGLLVQQLTMPVRWAESVDAMVSAGVDRFLELGPGSVLTGLNRRNARGMSSTALEGPDAIAEFRKESG